MPEAFALRSLRNDLGAIHSDCQASSFSVELAKLAELELELLEGVEGCLAAASHCPFSS